jgi:hypothetical protein
VVAVEVVDTGVESAKAGAATFNKNTMVIAKLKIFFFI